MTAETVTANEEYILTIHIDAEYLADEDTLYPITIDQTIEINNEQTYENFINNVEEDYSEAFCSRCKTMLQGYISDKILDKVYEGDE